MIWYQVPSAILGILFVMLLLAAAMYSITVLVAVDRINNRQKLISVRLRYSVLALFSAVLALELLLVIASIEGGVYMEIFSLQRYLAGLLPGWLLTSCKIFVAVWLCFGAVVVLLFYTKQYRLQVTRSILPELISNIGQGICVANRRGWILESNPAFRELCINIGLNHIENLDEFEAELDQYARSGRLEIRVLENGRMIRSADRFYLLQWTAFKTRWKKYVQLALSDVTRTTRAAVALEQENEMLRQHNLALEDALVHLEQEEKIYEREKLCRAAHDLWSQRLAVVGMTLDMLKENSAATVDRDKLDDLANVLDYPVAIDARQNECNLSDVLENLRSMYSKLGVIIEITGEASFLDTERQALCAIIREAMANAVRHAYARTIQITFFLSESAAGVKISNLCLDDHPTVSEGRGIHDMKSRIREVGGWLKYEKSSRFTLHIQFPRT